MPGGQPLGLALAGKKCGKIPAIETVAGSGRVYNLFCGREFWMGSSIQLRRDRPPDAALDGNPVPVPPGEAVDHCRLGIIAEKRHLVIDRWQGNVGDVPHGLRRSARCGGILP